MGLHGSVLHIHSVGLTHVTFVDEARSRSTVSHSVSIAVETGVAQFCTLSGEFKRQSGKLDVEIGVSLIKIVFFEAFFTAFKVTAMPNFHALVFASPPRTFPDASIVAKPRVPVTKVIYGFTFAICANALCRQIAQFVIKILVDGFQAGIDAGQHEDIVSERRRHFLAIANFSIAGNQLSA